MNKLTILVLMLGISGCSVTSAMSGVQVSHQSSKAWDGVLVESYDDLYIHSSKVRAEAMTITDGRTFHMSQSIGLAQYNKNWDTEQDAVNWHTKSRCEQLYKVECVISREGSRVIFGNYEAYKADKKLKDIKNEEYLQRLADLNDQAELEYVMSDSYYSKEDCDLMLSQSTEAYLICIQNYDEVNKSKLSRRIEIAEELKEKEEEKRLAVIHALKERCMSYGFTGSNNIAACVQREAQHDYEIEQKEYELQLTRQQLLVQQNQQQVAPQVPWYLSILEGVAEGIAEGYKQQALIQTMDSRYEKKDIYRYCRPNC